MPQASDTRRAAMERYFGDPIDEQGPMKFLRDNGFTLTKRWTWIGPDREPTEKEGECICFLIEEWDFDGLEPRRALKEHPNG